MSEQYNFDEVVNRRGSGSYKWDTPLDDGVLPMWVADMDFKAALPIQHALARRVAHGVFGYEKVPGDYYDAVTGWFSRRHGWTIEPQSMIVTIGVVPALSAIIKAITRPGDGVIVQSPVYNCFYSSIRNNGCVMVPNRLINTEGHYTMDFDDLERKAADPKNTLLLLCNPHNPVGRVWTAEELRRVGEICLRHGVFVVSDEIHCELTYSGHDYTPYATLGEEVRQNSAVCVSPSKAFNIAGLQNAFIVVEDKDVRRRIDRAINDNEVCDVNPFGVEAVIAAYNDSEEWLDSLRRYLEGNDSLVRCFFARHLERYRVTPLEGTYLEWIDCSPSGLDGDDIARRLLSEQKLMVSSGSIYGPGGEAFIRLNIACPRVLVEEGLRRMAAVLGRLPVKKS